MVPQFVVDHICKLVYFNDSDPESEFGPIIERFPVLHQVVQDYFDCIDNGFVSNLSEDLKALIELNVGPIEFNRQFSVRIRPNERERFFIEGYEIFE